MRALTPELERLLQRSEEQGAPFALSIIDLDYFKRINDECGHPTGDEVLQQLCRIVSATLKPGEVFARYGGEEFLLVTPDCNGGEHFRRMDALRAAIADYDWTPLTGILPVTISCGVASWYPGTDLGAMLQRADSALYMAKSQGRNRLRPSGGGTGARDGGDAQAASSMAWPTIMWLMLPDQEGPYRMVVLLWLVGASTCWCNGSSCKASIVSCRIPPT
ncbi:hypothetical protein CRN81_17360 [Chromobacterium violaceum]|nr:hypothetical protein CRN81_17360 [Chromobacterium violaceum]